MQLDLNETDTLEVQFNAKLLSDCKVFMHKMPRRIIVEEVMVGMIMYKKENRRDWIAMCKWCSNR